MKHTELVLVSLRSFWTLPLEMGSWEVTHFFRASGNLLQLLSGSEDGSQAGLLCEKRPCHLQDRVEFKDRDGNCELGPRVPIQRVLRSPSGRSHGLFLESRLFSTHTVDTVSWLFT